MSTERTVELRGKVPIRRRFTVAGMFALAAVLGSFPALAAEPEWPEGPYKYITLDQSVPDALVEFGRNIGVPVKVSEQVKGRMGPGLPRGTARQFLDALSQRYGLVWHYDGSTMNVSADLCRPGEDDAGRDRRTVGERTAHGGTGARLQRAQGGISGSARKQV